MDPSQTVNLINASQPSSAGPSSNRRQRRPIQTPRPLPKRQRTVAAVHGQSSRAEAPVQPQPPVTEVPVQPQQPVQEAQIPQNPPLPAQNNANAETGQRRYFYQFKAKLTRIYVTDEQYQSVAGRMETMTEKPALVNIMESMAGKLAHVDVLAPPRTLNLFPTEPSPFRPPAQDRRG